MHFANQELGLDARKAKAKLVGPRAGLFPSADGDFQQVGARLERVRRSEQVEVQHAHLRLRRLYPRKAQKLLQNWAEGNFAVAQQHKACPQLLGINLRGKLAQSGTEALGRKGRLLVEELGSGAEGLFVQDRAEGLG